MNRLLVAPWHGLISNSLIHLANGQTKPVRQPPNNPWGVSGPGDTHKIHVPGIAALTPEEIAATPLGGHYRVGEALISGDQLYGVTGLSWIYQDEAGSKWAIQLNNANVLPEFSTVRLDFSRFGEFGKASEVYTRGFIIPKGQPNGTDLNRIFVPQGFNTGAVRLHAVSESGRTAILALSAFNAPGTEANEAKTDTRRRNYCYIKFSLSGTGPMVTADMAILYASDAIYTDELLEFVGGSYQDPDALSVVPEEIDRVPLFNEAGEHYADRVSYERSGSVPMYPGGTGPYPLRSSWSQRNRLKWLVRVVFDGETPVPCYLTVIQQHQSQEMTFSVHSTQPRIADEWLTGGTVVTVQDEIYYITGSGSDSGSSVISWEGPGGPWSRSVSFSSFASFDGVGTDWVDTFDGVVSTYREPNGLLDIHYQWVPLETSRLPNFVGMPVLHNWGFIFYSNNLLAIIRQNDDNTARFDSVITSAETVAHDAACPQDQRHFGTYNPITAEFRVGSTVPVNWA